MGKGGVTGGHEGGEGEGGSEQGTVAGARASRKEEEALTRPSRGGRKARDLGTVGLLWGRG